MIYYIARRIVVMFVQLLLVVCGAFILLRLLPADPTSILTNEFSGPEEIAAAERQLGLDASIPSQLGDYLSGVVRGDLGDSWISGDPVIDVVKRRFPLTFQTVVLALALALTIAIVLGRAAATRAGSRFDRVVLNYTLFASAQPAFFWALVCVLVFFAWLGLAPAPIGLFSFDVTPPEAQTNFVLVDALLQGNTAAFFDALWHLAIPVILLGVLMAGPLLKMTRQGVITAVRSDYMLYARMSGLKPRKARNYMLRNALAPVLTLTGILFAGALGGIVLLESIFALPGIAIYTLESTKQLDFPAIQACVLVLTTFSLLVYLIMDILYAVLDPRVAYGKAHA